MSKPKQRDEPNDQGLEMVEDLDPVGDEAEHVGGGTEPVISNVQKKQTDSAGAIITNLKG